MTNRPPCFHSVKGGSHEKYSFYDITQISINRSISMYDNEMRISLLNVTFFMMNKYKKSDFNIVEA